MGPKSDKPSFTWVSKDVFDTLKHKYNVQYFKAYSDIPKNFDGLVFIIKEMPPLSFLLNHWKCKKVYMPVDFFKSEKHIKNASLMLKLFDRVAVHNDLLRPFINSTKVSNIDHYVKYLIERKEPKANYVWLGVVDYIPSLLRNLDKYPVLSTIPHVFLTDVVHLKKTLNSVLKEAESDHKKYDVEIKEDKVYIGQYCFEQWSEASQRMALESSAFAVDFKSDRFYHSTKPPTKVQVYLANGIPVFVNSGHYAVDYLSKFGITCNTMSNFTYPLTSEMRTSHSAKLRQMWSLESIAKQYTRIADQTLMQTKISFYRYHLTVLRLVLKKVINIAKSYWKKSP